MPQTEQTRTAGPTACRNRAASCRTRSKLHGCSHAGADQSQEPLAPAAGPYGPSRRQTIGTCEPGLPARRQVEYRLYTHRCLLHLVVLRNSEGFRMRLSMSRADCWPCRTLFAASVRPPGRPDTVKGKIPRSRLYESASGGRTRIGGVLSICPSVQQTPQGLKSPATSQKPPTENSEEPIF